MHAHAKLRRGFKLRPNQIARTCREDIMVVKASRAAMLHEFAHARQARQADNLRVEIFPDLIECFQPIEQFHILHLRQIAGKLLVQMMVRVDKARIAEHVAGIQNFIGLPFERRADGADHAVLGVEIDVFIYGILLVAGDKGFDVADQKSLHGGNHPFRSDISILSCVRGKSTFYAMPLADGHAI